MDGEGGEGYQLEAKSRWFVVRACAMCDVLSCRSLASLRDAPRDLCDVRITSDVLALIGATLFQALGHNTDIVASLTRRQRAYWRKVLLTPIFLFVSSHRDVSVLHSRIRMSLRTHAVGDRPRPLNGYGQAPGGDGTVPNPILETVGSVSASAPALSSLHPPHPPLDTVLFAPGQVA